ncbi:MAG TPA: DUF2505 family protein [Acidimicrobiia bacterium]|nr:DUF2505 family protein [Acidimicrobiia bacterium]
MRFEISQDFTGPPDAVARIYTDPRFYELLGGMPKLGKPEVLDRREEGSTVHLAVRFRFTGNLSAAVTRVVDPNKLSWVEDSVHDLGRLTMTFRMKPDHYADRLRSEGTARYEPAGNGGTRRVTEGDLAVRVPLVGRSAEGAIVSGLRDHLAAEIVVVERLLGGL